MDADGPYLLELQGRLLADEFALVPGFVMSMIEGRHFHDDLPREVAGASFIV